MDNTVIDSIDIRRLDLNLLRVFEAVSNERNVSRAANSLGLSQPAVSSAITRLRRILNDPLFLRTSHGVRPTPFAEQLLAPIETALSLIESALAPANATFEPSQFDRNFTLLMTDIGQGHYLGKLAKRLADLAPHVRLDVHPLTLGRFADALTSGTADIAIGYIGHLAGELAHERLFASRLVCLARRGHPSIGRTLSREQYVEASHVVEAARSSSSGFVTKALTAVGITRKSQLAVPTFLAMPTIVAASDLLATIPSELLGHIGHRPELNVFELPFDVPPFDISLCWSHHRQDDVALQWLREIMIELFGDNGSA